MQPLAILFGASLTVAVSLSLGALLLGRDSTDPGLRFVTGAALLSLLVFSFCAAHLAYPGVFALAGAAALLAARRRFRASPSFALPNPRLFLTVFALYFLLYFSNSMAPEFSFDGSRYHLSLVGRYLRDRGFPRITDNLYASLSQGIEILFLYAYAFGKHSAAAMVHFAFLLALAWMIFSYARRAGFPLPGACASLLVFASPLAGVDASSAYTDVAVAAIAFALFYLLQLWDAARSLRLLAAIGILAGFAYAAKYSAWVAVPYALAFVAWKSVAWKSRRWPDPCVVALFAALLILPWMAKNWIEVRNPLAPFFNQWFPNPYVTVSFESEYLHHLSWFSLPDHAQIPLQLTTFGSLSGLFGPVFLLSPIALLALRRPEGRQLFLAAVIFIPAFFTNASARFLIPALPFIALAMMLALASTPRLAIAIVLLHSLLSWPSVVRRYCHPDAWHLTKIPWREALRIKPEDGFLYSNLPLYGATRLVDQSTPPGSTVFAFTPIPEAYTERHIQVAYQSAAGIQSRAVLFTGFDPDYAPTWQLRFAFPRQPLPALRIVQTNSGSASWTIHQLRIFDGARPLAPDPAWSLTAHPYPWGIENVIGANPAAFWTCGDTLHPGQFVQLDFGRDQAADSLLLLTSPNQSGIRLELQRRDAAGRWSPLAAEPQTTNLLPPPDLRRAAARELKRRGIDYLLIFDHEFGADDLRQNADLWTIRQIGAYQDARLYQLP